MMNPVQQTTLKAFVLAVAQLEPPIAPDVDAVLTTINQELHTQPNRALDTIYRVVENHEQLNSLFRTEEQELYRRYNIRERDKSSLSPGQKSMLRRAKLRPTTPKEASLAKQPLCRFSDGLAAIAQALPEQISDNKDSFWETLQVQCAVAVGKVRLLDFSILSAIEHHPLTTEDLAYRLERPLEDVGQMIRRLWDARKIDTMGSGTLQKALPFLRSRQNPNPDAYWMLTSLGYFHLHPVLPLRQMGVRR